MSKHGYHGTYAFKGSDRFKQHNSKTDVDMWTPPPFGKGARAPEIGKYRAPRFSSAGTAVPKLNITAALDPYIPPTIGEDHASPSRKGTGPFIATTPRFHERDYQAKKVPTVHADPWNPPGIVDLMKKTKQGSLWARQSAKRFKENQKSVAEPDPIILPGFAEQILKTKQGAAWSRMKSERFKFNKTATHEAEPYVPPPLAARRTLIPATAAFRAKSNRFKDINASKKMDLPFYDTPSFVDEILGK